MLVDRCSPKSIAIALEGRDLESVNYTYKECNALAENEVMHQGKTEAKNNGRHRSGMEKKTEI